MAEKLATPDGAATTVGAAVDTEPDAEWVAHQREAARLADESEHAAPAKKDPEAPYGRKPDGTPKKRPGRPAKTDQASKPRIQRRSKAPAANSASATPTDRRGALDELMTSAWAVACIGNQADAGAIWTAKPGVVHTCNAAAQQSPMFAKGVDLLTGYTAVGMAFGTLGVLGLQIAANHGRVDPKTVAHLGIRSREELEAVNVAATEAMVEEMVAAQAMAEAASA